jgi:DNA-directed RNA polymerase I, II, and III subunit RPABC1
MATIYKARKTLATILEARGFDTSVLKEENEHEVDLMTSNDTLDFSLRHPQGAMVYVHFDMQFRPLNKNNLEKITKEFTLTSQDCLIIIAQKSPSNPFYDALREAWKHSNIFVQAWDVKELQIDISQHKMVPKHRIINSKEEEELFKKYSIKDRSVLPVLDREDAMARWLGARPDQIAEIERGSETSAVSKYYRCVANEILAVNQISMGKIGAAIKASRDED